MLKDRFSSGKNYFTFMIVPPNGKGTVNIRLSKGSLTFLGLLLIFFISLVGGSIFLTTQTSTKLLEYQKLKAKTNTKTQEINTLNNQFDNLSQEVQNLLEQEEEIKNIINKYQKKKYYNQPKKSKAHKFKTQYNNIIANNNSDLKNAISVKYTFLNDEMHLLRKKYKLIHKKLKNYETRYSVTPSTWPLYGRIISSFGWRIHPLRRKLHFHKGIDIPSWIGAPIKATADGIVVYSGWGGGYGLVVGIDHGFGFMSMYAHASKTLVKRGEVIKKGQKIANVGNTGISTGPHIHYEIRRWRKAINPKPFLDLDLFTASEKIW